MTYEISLKPSRRADIPSLKSLDFTPSSIKCDVRSSHHLLEAKSWYSLVFAVVNDKIHQIYSSEIKA
jgi:hypothetical protein